MFAPPSRVKTPTQRATAALNKLVSCAVRPTSARSGPFMSRAVAQSISFC